MADQLEVPRYAKRIAQLNDNFRIHRLGRGRLMITRGFDAQGPKFVQNILGLVAAFDDFSLDNHPYEEHDFGQIELDGEKIFWKFDYYSPDLKWGSEDPSDETKTCRVLTIMLANEY